MAATPAALPSRPTAPSGTVQSWSYSYDRLSRLLTASGPTTSTTYSYDPVGNRQSMSHGTNTAYSYDRADRLTAAGSTSYTVNANGNTTARGSDNFGYDQANRLISATVNATQVTYTWDGDGKRASATSGGATTSYLYDVNGGLPVLLEDGSRKYVWGLGLAYAVDASGNVEVYHTDGLGSVRALTDASQTVIARYETDEFGVPISTTGTSGQPFGYTGEQRDSQTGLVYLRARLYEPGVGRFLQRDPGAGRGEMPESLNRYGYVQNNPVGFVDRSGLCRDPNPGGGGVRYCIERAIQEPWVGPVRGDGRMPNPTGGSYRTQQLVHLRQDGTVGYAHSTTATELSGVATAGLLGRCEIATAKNRVLAECVAYNGLGRLATAPIQYTLVIDRDSASRSRVVFAHGTPYPDLEVWQYTDDSSSNLLFYYNSQAPTRRSVIDLYTTTNLSNEQSAP